MSHVVVLGEQNSGRTSVLVEIARQAKEDKGRLVVNLASGDSIANGRSTFLQGLLTAIVEELAARVGSNAPWYRAWRSRVYLRNMDRPGEDDLLSSALILAADPAAEIDRAILERDLSGLLQIALEAGLSGILICIDDASTLSEDVRLVEEIVSVLDALDGYSLLMAGLPSVAAYFTQAASPCLERCVPVWLSPFRGPNQVYTALSAPLSEEAAEYLQPDDTDLLRDILQLTGGNPYELMVVGHFLWLSCQLGEQDAFALTPRVLDRVIPALSQLTNEGDALLDGAMAIDRLPEEHVRQAVELVGLSRLTVREIAIARLLKVGDGDSGKIEPDDILGADIAEEEGRVHAEADELQEAGVIQIHADQERFNVVGGRPAEVLLKYKARARIGAEASSAPFGLDFLSTVGWALSRDAMLRTLPKLPEDTISLGYSAVMAQGGGIGRLSLRPAIRGLVKSDDIKRLAQSELDLTPWGVDAYKRIVSLLGQEEPCIALICTSLMYGRDQFEYVEAWELPSALDPAELTQAISDVAEEWEPVVEAADIKWSSNEHAVLRSHAARKVLIILQRFAAVSAVFALFRQWRGKADPEALERATKVAEESIKTVRESGQSDAESVNWISSMLSRLGFLHSFNPESLDEAAAACEEARQVGKADGWVTTWNLANICAQRGDLDAARAHLEQAAGEMDTSDHDLSLLFFVPGRDAANSFLQVGEGGIGPLLELQQLIYGSAKPEDLSAAIERCRSCGEDSAIQAANWVSDALLPQRA
jgi:hypothetical protein